MRIALVAITFKYCIVIGRVPVVMSNARTIQLCYRLAEAYDKMLIGACHIESGADEAIELRLD